jgi:uncharacterized protein (TIGR02186 family)
MKWILILLALAAPLRAEEIVSGVSTSGVSITTNFNGTAIMVYGAAIREAPPPEDSLLDVIVTVEGPPTPLVIRKKERVAGIWLNRGALVVASAPSFYAVATTGDLDTTLSAAADAEYHITIPSTIEAFRGKADQGDYLEALQRIRAATGQYKLAKNSVLLLRQALFRTDITLPANLVEGDYRVRIFLTRKGEVIDSQENVIAVEKAGLERWLYNLAMQQPLIYGVISLVLAMVAGWGASEAFRRLRL